jgi:DNA-binding NarL/FixJ family response regulator
MPVPVSEITVLIVEPVPVVRCGLEAMVGSISEVGTRRSATSLAEAGAAVAEAPRVDAVIASASVMAEADGRGVLDAIPTIVLVPSDAPRDLEVATSIEVDGYLMFPDVTPDLLRGALQDVLGGRMSLPAPVASHLLKRARGDDPVVVPRVVRFSPREEEVMELLVAGLSNRQIADELGISIHGAKRHVSSILNKLNSPSRAHLVSRVLRSGIVRQG